MIGKLKKLILFVTLILTFGISCSNSSSRRSIDSFYVTFGIDHFDVFDVVKFIGDNSDLPSEGLYLMEQPNVRRPTYLVTFIGKNLPEITEEHISSLIGRRVHYYHTLYSPITGQSYTKRNVLRYTTIYAVSYDTRKDMVKEKTE